MWARVTTIVGEASRSDDAVQMINGEVIPRMKELGMAAGGYWMINRDDGRVVAVTLYETEQALRDSEAAAAALREKAGQMGGTTQSVDVFEVVGQL
jgi:hypothetical protein